MKEKIRGLVPAQVEKFREQAVNDKDPSEFLHKITYYFELLIKYDVFHEDAMAKFKNAVKEGALAVEAPMGEMTRKSYVTDINKALVKYGFLEEAKQMAARGVKMGETGLTQMAYCANNFPNHEVDLTPYFDENDLFKLGLIKQKLLELPESNISEVEIVDFNDDHGLPSEIMDLIKSRATDHQKMEGLTMRFHHIPIKKFNDIGALNQIGFIKDDEYEKIMDEMYEFYDLKDDE